MALLQIDACDGTPRLFGTPHSLSAALASALRQTPGPVTILIHGYKYAPDQGVACPHLGLFAMKSHSPNPKVIAWPRHLKTDGVTLGFGWAGRGALRDVYARAFETGAALAELIKILHHLDPARKIHVLSHSMGARVALSALPRLPAKTVSSVLMLAAAEYRSQVAAAMASPAGQSAHIWHITSGENDLYDFLFERLIRAPERGDQAIGTAPLPGLNRIVLDDAETLDRLDRLGYRIAPPARRFCHWSPYLRGGVFGLYSALIRGDLCAHRLRQALPAPQKPRWSRIVPRFQVLPLPIAGDASV